MKVRARVKAKEHLPNWTRCCDAPLTIDAERMEWFTVDLSRKITGDTRCKFCGADAGTRTKVVGYFPSGEGLISLDILDLDEGAAH